MGTVINYLIKVVGLRKFFAITLFSLKVVFLASLATFVLSLGYAITKLYDVMIEIINAMTSASFGGTMGGNDITSIVWSVLDTLGFIDVFESFVPIVFSTVVGYLSLYLISLVLTFQKNVYRAIQDFGVIFLGS